MLGVSRRIGLRRTAQAVLAFCDLKFGFGLAAENQWILYAHSLEAVRTGVPWADPSGSPGMKRWENVS